MIELRLVHTNSYMASDNERFNVDVSGGLGDAVRELAKLEERSLSSMCRQLIREALDARKDKEQASLQKFLHSLHNFSIPSLAKITEKAGQLIYKQSSHAKLSNPASKFVSGWNLTELVKVSGISLERLLEIQQGALLMPDEETGLIRAGMNPDELRLSYFQDDFHKEEEQMNGC